MVRLGDYLNILRYNDLDGAMQLEAQMVELDKDNLHLNWRDHLISLYRYFNPHFPENFKIKVCVRKLPDQKVKQKKLSVKRQN